MEETSSVTGKLIQILYVLCKSCLKIADEEDKINHRKDGPNNKNNNNNYYYSF